MDYNEKEQFCRLYDFLAMQDAPRHADIIFIFGSTTMPQVWHHAHDLYVSGYAQKIYVAGGFGKRLRAQRSALTEAEMIRDFLVQKGVPQKQIFIEKTSTNTLENVVHAQDFMEKHSVTSLIAVSKPFHMRRIYATCKKHLPHIRVFSCPPSLDYAHMQTNERDYILEKMHGEIQRLQKYGKKGDIAHIAIPEGIDI